MLTARLSDVNEIHARFQVFLDGVNIGHLCVNTEDAKFLEGALNSTPDSRNCPQLMEEHLIAYRDLHRPVGHFLTAVLSNDLTEAVARADDYNLLLIRHIVAWCYHHLPHNIWGSVQEVQEHLLRRPAPDILGKEQP